MKHKLLYLFLLFVIVVTGCAKKSTENVAPPIPSGTFTGEYQRYHRHTNQLPWDSVKTNLTINFTTPAYTYKVTGDTSTVHAGSYGTFGITYPFINFNDKTYSPTTTATKAHLEGYYNYAYDGTNLQMYVTSSDTLIINYTLKKQ
ncbi:MAG TPA: hypothetical protein VIM89_13530 [Mucilaginibacter sp.]